MSRKKLTIGILVLVICVLGLLAMGMLLRQNTVASEQAKKDRGFMTDNMHTNQFLSIEGLRNARQLGGCKSDGECAFRHCGFRDAEAFPDSAKAKSGPDSSNYISLCASV